MTLGYLDSASIEFEYYKILGETQGSKKMKNADKRKGTDF